MKNLKKILLSMMVLFLAFAFIGCPAEPDPVPETPVTPEPETPVTPVTPEPPVNNFKGNVFVAEYSVNSYPLGYWGYIEFLDDTNGKMGIPDYDEAGDPIIREQPFTYSVTDDKATLKATMEGEEFTVTTEKLTDGRFTFSYEDVNKVNGETYSVLMTCTKDDKSLFDVWTVLYEVELMKDFFYVIDDFADSIGLDGDDYDTDDATKTITLTVSGWEKVRWTVVDQEGNILKTFASDVDAYNFVSSIGLQEDTDYTGDDEARTITLLTEDSCEIVNNAYTVLDPDRKYLMAFPSLEAAGSFATAYGLSVTADYAIDNETQTITLTADGWEKLQPWTVLDLEGNVVETFACLKEAEDFASTIGLAEGEHYSKDDAENTITLTAAGLAKVQEAMGGV